MLGKRGAARALPLGLNEEEKQALERSAETLKGVINEVRKDFKVGEKKVEAVEEEVKAAEGAEAKVDEGEKLEAAAVASVI